jgi:hypothetical protein
MSRSRVLLAEADRQGLNTLPGAVAPNPERRVAAGTDVPEASVSVSDDDDRVDPDEFPFLILSATGAVLAEGTRDALSAQALRLAQIIPKNHPVFLAFTGGVLAFATLAALMEHLAPMTDDRTAGWPGPLRAYSLRARARAGTADRAVTSRLDPSEWSVHHLVGVDSARDHLPLLIAPARAGWRMDAEENLMVLPRNRAAQAKLAAAGIERPVHDNGHLQWNSEVKIALARIEDELRDARLRRENVAYDQRARQLLERLQSERRRKAKDMDRIVQREPVTEGLFEMTATKVFIT